MRVVFEGTYSELKLLNNPSKVLKDLGFFKSNKVKLLNNNIIIIVLFNWQINIFFVLPVITSDQKVIIYLGWVPGTPVYTNPGFCVTGAHEVLFHFFLQKPSCVNPK